MGFLSRIFQRREADSVPVRRADVPGELRSIENPAFQVNPAQLDMLWGYGPTRSGVQINERTALSVVAVYAAIKILSESLGMLPWAVYEGDEDEKQRRRAKEHPAYKLLRWQPNEEMTAITFKETLMGHAAGWGNCYARIFRDNADRPTALCPLLPDEVYPERLGGQLVYRLLKTNETLWPEDIFHVPLLGYDGLKGYSPIALARESIAGGKAAEIYGATFFGNGGFPGAVMEWATPGIPKPEAVATFREQWQAMHGGTGNAHKIGVLPMGAKYTRIGIPPDEAQFVETKKFSIVDVARLYRLPPHMLADQSHAPRANIEQASLEFIVYTMSPWFVRFEEEAKRKLCPDGEYYVRFDEKMLLRSDMAARQQYYIAARQWGWKSANDILRDEGESSIGPQGDVYLSPVNMQNAKVTATQTEPVPPAGGSGRPGEAPMGGAPSPSADLPKQRAIAAAASQVVFEDAIGRMLRKESGLRSRGKTDDATYATHAGHVREALAPAVKSLGTILGDDLTEHPAIDPFATQRHEDLNGNIPALAASLSKQLIRQLTENV